MKGAGSRSKGRKTTSERRARSTVIKAIGGKPRAHVHEELPGDRERGHRVQQ
jgi:hypothetical protein